MLECLARHNRAVIRFSASSNKTGKECQHHARRIYITFNEIRRNEIFEVYRTLKVCYVSINKHSMEHAGYHEDKQMVSYQERIELDLIETSK